jgi:DNA-nicking Smr family endonuclease
MARRVTPDEHELWQRVARATRRLQPAPDPDVTPRAARNAPLLRPDPAAPPPRHPGSVVPPRITVDLAVPLAERLAQAPMKLARGTHSKMMRGKMTPDGRIDLHGMTLSQAQPALRGFLMAAQARGDRLVLVITGKGSRADGHEDPMPRRVGALRHEVPHWLHSAPLASVVLDVRPAHRSHGGAGALYVYLRRPR